MNITTLQKCVEELKKETPNISYVLGMLETVIEMDRVAVPSYPSYPTIGSGVTNVPYMMPVSNNPIATGSGLVSNSLSEEDMYAEKYAGGPIATVQ